VATILGSSLTFIDATVVNVALPALQTNLHATITDVQWVIEAYALFLGALILVGGSLGDQAGRRRVFLGGVVLFTAASIACGSAASTRALITARAVQGVGAAFLVPGSLAIISATFDDEHRGRAIGTWSGFSAITSAIGPIAGGWLIEHVSWRAIFFVNAPLAVVVILLSMRFMDESRDPSRSGPLDWAGATLAVCGLGAVVFALLEWPQPAGARPIVLSALIAGIACLSLFALIERRVRSPMVPPDLFESRTFTLANLLTFLLYGALATVLWLVPLNLIQVQHYSATAAGGAFLPFPLLMFLLSRWAGGLVARVGSRLPLTIGPLVSAAALLLYARPAIGGSYWTTFFPPTVLAGLGMSIVVAPLTTTVMSAVDAHRAGVASGVNNAVSRIAGLVAIAVLGVVLVRTFDARVNAALGPVGIAADERAMLRDELPKLAGADLERIEPAHRSAVRGVVDRSFVAAFRVVMIAAAGIAFAAGLAGAGIRDRPLFSRSHEDHEGCDSSLEK
jgi:EmrB/QacA subfamily drug resistance transporter